MRVHLAYGTDGLDVEVPDDAVVVRPVHGAVPAPAADLVRAALATPLGTARLRDRVRPTDRVAIAVCDGTRPQPRRVMLEAILDELDGIVPDDQVVVLVATGTHRPNTPAELEAMLGLPLLERLEVVNHDAADPARLVERPPAGSGVPVLVNRRFAEADVRITTGFVEPHFFAGFSGGPKLVAPGLAGTATIHALHDARHIGDPRASFGIVQGNPVHDDVRAVAAAIGVHHSCDVVLDAEQRVVACFAGDLSTAHAAACGAARAAAMRPVADRFEVVVTTNAGFPLDQNLYQAVKGMAAAAQVVRPGGRILVAARCADGFPDGSAYERLVTSMRSPAHFLDQLAGAAGTLADQWQVQVQARVQAVARVGVRTDGVTPDDLRRAHLDPVEDLSAAVADALRAAGPGARCCVLPEGPQTIPYVAGEAPPAG